MSRVLKVDFTGVEVGGSFVRIPESDYGLEIAKIEPKKGEESGKPYLLFYMKVISGDKRGIGKMLPHTCSLQKKALWNLRNLLESCGMQVPSKAVNLNLDKLIKKQLAGTVVDDVYEGKKKSVISALFPLADLENLSDGEELDEGTEEESEVEEIEEEAEEEVEESPKKAAGKKSAKKKGKPKDEEELEEAEEEEQDDLFN